MSKSKSRGGSCNPFGCLFLLIGLGFLATGIFSGTVANEIGTMQANSPDSSASLNAFVIWAAITFVSLGLGFMSLWFNGLRDSFMGFGVILSLLGLAGLSVHYTGTELPESGNAFWEAVNYLIGLTGSLLYTSIAIGGFGFLLVIIILLAGEGQEASNRQPTANMQIVACARCGHHNPSWYAVCEKCGSRLSLIRE